MGVLPFLLGFTPWKAGQPLRDAGLQEQEAHFV